MSTSSALHMEPCPDRLARHAGLLEKLLEATSDGVWLFDPARTTTYVNGRLASMLGYAPNDMVGRDVSAFIDEDAQRRLEACFMSSRCGSRAQLECKVRCKNGDVIWVLVTTATLRDEANRAEVGIAVLSDITVRKAAEEQLARMNEELERRLAERTQALVEANRKLAELASVDPLTGLLNRRAFDERLEQEIARAHRYETPLSLLIADVDHFKHINDSAGHHAGDAVLRHVANLLTSEVRASDVVGRYGGEEFVILAPHTSRSGARVLAERIRATAQASDCHAGDFVGAVTVSVGVGELRERNGSARDLLLEADASLYGAKRAGRNRVGD